MDRLKSGCKIRVDISKKQKMLIGLKEILVGGGIGFGCVSYPGQGKYANNYWEESKEHFVRWSDVEDEDNDLLPPTPVGSPSSGWWPVCQISWLGEAQLFGLEPGTYFIAQCGGRCAVWILRWYQLWEGEWELQAWPIWLAPWSRM